MRDATARHEASTHTGQSDGHDQPLQQSTEATLPPKLELTCCADHSPDQLQVFFFREAVL
jgi:hypothetical protein